VLLIDGEWGIGRSLLLRASEREAAVQGFSLAAGTADQVGRELPFFALLVALHEPFGSRTNEDHHDLADALAWRLGQIRERLEQRAAATPVLVTLDDLQWASPATLLALRVLPRELVRYPVAWILARASTQQDNLVDLLFRVLESDGAIHLWLAPLTDDAVTSVLTEAFGAPPDRSLLALASGAAGNPALLTELILGLRDDNAVKVTDGYARSISDQLPQRIHTVARRRLDGLSQRTRHLLKIAALLGRSFRLEDVAEMLGEPPAALLPTVEEAMEAGIVTAIEDTLSFRQELLRHPAAETIPPPVRRTLHRQLGEILLNRGSAVMAAEHLLEATHSSDPAALNALDRAAAETLHSSPQTAADLALRALELTPPADTGTLSRSVAAAEALTAAGRLEQAAHIAHDTLAQPRPAVTEARLRCALSSIWCTRGRAHDASAEAGTVLAQPQLPDGLRDQAMIAELQAVAGLRDEHAVGRIAAAILAAPDEYGDQVVAAALSARAMISWDKGRISEGLEFLRDAARQGTGVSADARNFQPLLALAAGLVDLRRFDEAATVLRGADNETLHGIPSEGVAAILRARMHLAKGHLKDAAAEGEAALANARTLVAHGYASVAHCVLSVIAMRRGDLRAAANHIASCSVRVPHFADVYARTESVVAEARITEARDGPAAAIGQIREICADLPAHNGMLFGEPTASAWLVRTALAAGDQALAAEIAHVTGSLARDNPDFRTVTAAAAHCQGLLDQDPACLAQAAAQHKDPWARASAAEDIGALLAVQADEDGAVHHLVEALSGYGLAGATTDQARIRRRLRRLGVRQRHWASSPERPVTGWESLTETERFASELVAQGLSNRQAADRMYVSVHTIASHLRQVFRKLDIGSRVELARVVIEQASPRFVAEMEKPGSGLPLAS